MAIVKYRAYVILVLTVLVLTASLVIVLPTVSAQETETETDEQEDEFNPFETGVIHEFPNGAELYHVEFEDGEATVYIYLEQSLTNERVSLSPAISREGVVPETSTSLREGENVVSVQLQDTNGVGVSTGGEGYAVIDRPQYSITQDVPYPWVLSIGGIFLLAGFTLAINQLMKRKTKKPKNAIKT